MNIFETNEIRTHKDATEGITCVYHKAEGCPEDHRMHLNSMCEIYIFVAGEADYIVESRCFPLEPYDVLILNPYEPHTPLLKGRELYERFYFLVPVDSFVFMDNDPMDVLLKENKKGNNRISLPPEKKEQLKGLLETFKTGWQRRDRVASLSAYSAFLGILSLLGGHILGQSLGEPAGTEGYKETDDMPPIILDVLRYIEKHLAEDFSEEDLAANFHISAPYLSRLFKNKIKMGLKKYVLLRRVGVAKKVLSSGKSVTETCFECGFNDCSYFIKVFKTYTGVTPYKYQMLSKNQRME